MWCIRCSSLNHWTAGLQHFSTLLSENALCAFCTQLTKYVEPKYMIASHDSYIATVCVSCHLKWNSDSRVSPHLCSWGYDFPPLLWSTSLMSEQAHPGKYRSLDVLIPGENKSALFYPIRQQSGLCVCLLVWKVHSAAVRCLWQCGKCFWMPLGNVFFSFFLSPSSH